MLGRRDDAIREGNRACELPLFQGFLGWTPIDKQSGYDLRVGRRQGIRSKQLEASVNVPSGISYGD
jgi:hypothetical protein